MKISELYNIVGIVSMLFNIILAIITYRNKKSAEGAMETIEDYKTIVKEISTEVSENYENIDRIKKKAELFADLLSNLSSIEKNLDLLKKDEKELRRQGISVSIIVNNINDVFSHIQNNSFVFKSNDYDYSQSINEFKLLIESYETSSTAERKLLLKQLTDINVRNTVFLRKIRYES